MSETTTGVTGAYELPDELRLLQDTVADFMAQEVRPAESGEDPDAWHLPEAKRGPLQAKARAAGLWCLASPEEHGGGGLGVFAQTLVAEQAAKCRMGLYVAAAGAFGAHWAPSSSGACRCSRAVTVSTSPRPPRGTITARTVSGGCRRRAAR